MTDTTNQTNNGKGKPKKQRLELTWIGKDEELKLEPRILIEDPEKSYGDPNTENMLIHGDNLLALKALEQDYAGKVKCIYIDPPYNTGSAFEHYDDNLEHSIWLDLMMQRLSILKNLLRNEGSIWITLDDNEAFYCKVMCDEIFGRNNFIGSVVWQHSLQSKGYEGKFSLHHNYILAYRKTDLFFLNTLPRTEEHNVNYSNPDNDPRGPWRSGDVRNSLVRKNLMYDISTPSGKTINHPPKGWRFSKETFERELKEGKIMFSSDESRIIRKIYLADQKGRVPETIWFGKDVGTTREANQEIKSFDFDTTFGTPKPERLIERVLTLATNEGDIVLDSFLGSGTTSAVAHKMKRRWIGVELGEHANTHCLPRLKKVVDGTDGLPLSETLEWKGGGGFKFYNLAPSLLRKDKYGNWIIDEKYNANMLAAAMCKHEGFRFSPHEELYWKQGKSTETDYIFVTTAFVTVEQLDKIHEEMSSEESLLICAKSFAPECEDRHPNITIKKIPQMILGKCEYGQDNYDLNIIESTEEVAEDQNITDEDDE
jgi:adenine-specific DNA-methyltransferase